MITLEFDDEGNVVRKPKEKKSQSFHFVPRSLGEGGKPPATGTQQPETTQPLNLELSTLQAEYATIKLQRDKLSTSIAPLVESIRIKLLAESPELAAAFMRGDMAMPELRELRGKIDSLQEQMMEVFDKIEHVKKYGTLPPPAEHKVLSGEGDDIKAIRHDIRRLDDLIYKTNKKLEDAVGKTVKADRKLDWIEKKSLAEAQRDELKHKIKRLEYEQRAKASQQNG
jgi:predicted  nucleic acid-binding Zn-ribbon protein